VDFEDVKAVMKDSGMALLGCGTGRGENRIEDAIRQAMESPLLNDYDLTTAKNTLINITVGYNDQGLMTKELKNIDSIISKYTGNANRFKRGIVYNYDEDFGDRIDITVIATGFKMNTLETIIQPNIGNIIVIGDNFKYDGSQGAEEVVLTGSDPMPIKIGHHSTYNVRKFHFTEDNMPVLAGDIDNRIGELETVPAIERRKSHHPEEKN
jgi:cell division protein FtsZ